MRLKQLLSYLAIVALLLCSEVAISQTTVTIGTGTSSSSTRGPFQRADTASSTVFSRWVIIYTASELATAGIPNGATISALNWELASSNVIIGSGDANLKIYIKNSTATAAVADTWANHITGSSLAFDQNFNTSNNFPGANGWMPFNLTTPFNYTGGAIEIAVDWDCSQVSTPAFSGNGAIKWRWASTAPDNLVVKKTSSSAPSTNITDLKDERANIQMVYTLGSTCNAPSGLSASNITMSSADVSWAAVSGATSYNWKVVAAGAGSGGTAVATGNTSMTSASASGLMTLTSYDLYVETDCGGGSTSAFAGPYTFLTSPSATTTVTIGTGTSSSSTRGPFQRSDVNSSTVFSRFVHVYTAAELAAVGITSGMNITEVQWELASSNVIIGSGDANLKVYAKNSSATMASSDTWANHIMGSTLVVNNNYNTTNNFPGANGWMPFAFSTPFTYTGGALEIAVDWDCSQVSTPAFSGDGSLKWRWASTAPDNLVVKKTSSSSPSTNITDLKDERANIQLVYASAALPDSVDITFLVNTANITVNPTGLYLAGGGNFGSPGDNPMSDANNDGVYEITVRKPKGFSSFYIFSNGNDPSFGQKEQIGGLPCADPNNYNDRFLNGVYSDTTLLTCYETCATDTVCPMLPPPMMDPDLPLTFEDTATVNYNLVDFGNINTPSMVVVDPTNPNNLVVQTTKSAGSAIWAGTTLGDAGLVNPIPFTATNQKMYVDVWSPTANTPILLKVENVNDGQNIFAQVEVNTTMANAWETLEFDFANPSSGSIDLNNTYGKVVIFYNFGTSGADETYYCDNVAYGNPVSTKRLEVDANLFTIQPNLADNFTNLRFANYSIVKEKTIIVQNAMGQVILNTTLQNTDNYRINTSTFSNGMYFITVRTDEGIYTKRLVISH